MRYNSLIINTNKLIETYNFLYPETGFVLIDDGGTPYHYPLIRVPATLHSWDVDPTTMRKYRLEERIVEQELRSLCVEHTNKPA